MNETKVQASINRIVAGINEKVQETGGALSARSPATTGCASVTTE